MKKSVLSGVVALSAVFGAVHSASAALLATEWTDLTTTGVLSYDATTSTFISSNAVRNFNVGGVASVPDSTFSITSGFKITNTVIFDATTGVHANDHVVGPDDTVLSVVGAGTFEFRNSLSQLILSGTFTGGSFTSAIGSTGGVLTASSGLVLTPGPAFPPYASYGTPYAFSVSLVAIPGGLSVSGVTPVLPGSLWLATPDSFASAAGSVNTSAEITFVPEPSAMSALLLPAAGLLKRRRRQA